MNSGIVNKNIIVYYIRKWVRLLCLKCLKIYK